MPFHIRTNLLPPLFAGPYTDASDRFHETLVVPPARWLAVVALHVTGLERLAGIAPTQFELRDRMTQALYLLDTEPPWDSDVMVAVEFIRQQFVTGGPSGLGARWCYVHEFLAKARTALAIVLPAFWEDPPAGIGIKGAIFGAHLRIAPPGLSGIQTRTVGGRAQWPVTPSGVQMRDASLWDWFAGDPHPLTSDGNHYLPIEKLLPGQDQFTGYFERLAHGVGTTPNAGREPPDRQVLGEFDLNLGTIPSRETTTVTTSYDAINSTAYELNPPFAIVPVPNLPPSSASTTATVVYGTGVDLLVGAEAGEAPTNYIGPPHYWAGIQKFNRAISAKTSWEEFSGVPWKRSMYDWLSYRNSWRPDSIRLRGTLDMLLTAWLPGESGSGTATAELTVNGQVIGTMTATVNRGGPFINTANASLDVDADISAMLAADNFLSVGLSLDFSVSSSPVPQEHGTWSAGVTGLPLVLVFA